MAASGVSRLAFPYRQRGRHYPLHIHIAYLFTLLIFVACSVISWFNYYQSRRIILSAASDVFESVAVKVSDDLERLYRPLETLVELLVYHPIVGATSLDRRAQYLPMLLEFLEKNRQLSAVYVGYDNGDFFLFRRLPAMPSAEFPEVPKESRYLLQSMERGPGGQRRPTYVYYDKWLYETLRLHPENYDFDPRVRPWFVEATAAPDLIRTEPYVFFTTREIGKTFARASATGAVVAADLTLADISSSLAEAKVTAGSQLVLVDERGGVLASRDRARLAQLTAAGDGRLPALADFAVPALDRLAWDHSDRPIPIVDAHRRTWHGRALSLGDNNRLLMAAPEDELLAQAVHIRSMTLWITLLMIGLAIPGTWWLARRVASELNDLLGESREIRRFRFDGPQAKGSPIWEIDQLAQSMHQMKGTIRKFLDITATLSAERNFERLLDRVLLETLSSAEASGGVVYLVADDGQRLLPAALRWQVAEGDGGGEPAAILDLPPLPLAAVETSEHPVLRSIRHGKALAQEIPVERPAGMAYLDAVDSPLAGKPVLQVAMPLKNRNQDMVGLLVLFLPGDAGAPPIERISFIEALSGASAVAIDNQRLIQSQKALLESLIQLVAGAIDAKSPYTGGHCQRVPELTKMLARAACESTSGPYADFQLSEDEWEALHIAGWLHDCGKVTTPEYVVDKATKLETLYDRIHEVRMRFEVLKRDAEVEFWRAVAAGGDSAKLRAALEAQWRVLDEEFAFVAACNQGGEFMAAEKVARLQEIGARTWLRTLDDRLGVSRDEARRQQRCPAPTLPVSETLLADKPEHLVERDARDLLPPDNPWGFKLRVPQWKFNRGELHNLRVARGTLSDEDRYIINDHIVQTIIMLTALPFPRHLRTVPELAGGHHERADGAGYPRGLKQQEMSPQARMMAIADVFEALTAEDRPYKKGKTLAEALRIMVLMRDEGHIDPELFALFVEAGVYRRYAERFLSPEQIDAVDEAALLRTASKA